MSGISEADLEEVLETTEDVWRSLRGGRIFLAGATGFYGAWLLSSFAHAVRRLDLRIPVAILTRDPAAARSKFGAVLDTLDAELVVGDTRSFEFPSGTFSHVVHGATSASAALTEANPDEMLDVIIGGTRRMLELARQARCSRFLFMSSGAVYGPQPSSMTHIPESYTGTEFVRVDASNIYAEGKRKAEKLCWPLHPKHEFEIVSARGFAFVGPYLPLDTHFAIGNFVRDAMAGGPIEILGDGTPYRSYMYGSDLAAWMWTLLAKGRAETAYNVGSDDGRPLREIAARVATQAGVEVHVAKEPPPDHVPSRYVPDVSRATNELRLSIRVPLDEAIRRTLVFHRRLDALGTSSLPT